MSLPGGGWTVILRRKQVKSPDATQINFTRSWNEYVRGFGDFSSEFFLGLEDIRSLTEKGDMELFIGLQPMIYHFIHSQNVMFTSLPDMTILKLIHN